MQSTCSSWTTVAIDVFITDVCTMLFFKKCNWPNYAKLKQEFSCGKRMTIMNKYSRLTRYIFLLVSISFFFWLQATQVVRSKCDIFFDYSFLPNLFSLAYANYFILPFVHLFSLLFGVNLGVCLFLSVFVPSLAFPCCFIFISAFL